MYTSSRSSRSLTFHHSDQMCSLTFTMANLYSIGCLYTHRPENSWGCIAGTSHTGAWAIPFVLAVTPIFMRAVQCVRRYAESRALTQLINVSRRILQATSCEFFTVTKTSDFPFHRPVNIHPEFSATYFCSTGGTMVRNAITRGTLSSTLSREPAFGYGPLLYVQYDIRPVLGCMGSHDVF